jgi:threonine dehydrogenase-like Zn-dependent dehydrogenase
MSTKQDIASLCRVGSRYSLGSPAYAINEHEITIRGSFSNPFTHQGAVALAASGRVRLLELVSDRIALDELPRALDPAAPQPAGKVLVQPAV